jgi:II/X family phage/plasmid replication protein
MIDWLTLIIPLPHKHFIGGKTLFIDEFGELVGEKFKGKSFEGSADSTIYAASNNPEELFIHGNPAKFLQGHNVFGIDNPYRLTELLFNYLYDNDLIEFNIFDVKNALDNAKIVRMDINKSYDLLNNDDVDIFINALHYKGKTRHGKAQRKGGTVYFGKNSKRYALKFYNKFAELNTIKESKKIIENLTAEQINLIYKEAKPLLRAELVLRSLELKEKGIDKLGQWKGETMSKKIFNTYLKKLDINKQVALTDEIENNLPNVVKLTYYKWFHSKQELIPGQSMSKTSYYRHRKALKEYGIDISIPRDIKKLKENQAKGNEIPFFRILEATPKEIPQSFYDMGLIAM